MAMSRFDKLVAEFDNAIKNSKRELEEQGFVQVDEICEQILKSGGIKNFRS